MWGWMLATMWMNLRTQCLVQEGSHRRPHILLMSTTCPDRESSRDSTQTSSCWAGGGRVEVRGSKRRGPLLRGRERCNAASRQLYLFTLYTPEAPLRPISQAGKWCTLYAPETLLRPISQGGKWRLTGAGVLLKATRMVGVGKGSLRSGRSVGLDGEQVRRPG